VLANGDLRTLPKASRVPRVETIDLVLIDQQSVGKRSLLSDGHFQCEKEMDDHLTGVLTSFEKEPHSDTRCQRASIIFEN
jgi:hypothetical protein